ncbi:hypothetical protein RHODGE_RHODGE_04105 [Rhodoplanes serenus]|uniref:T2SS protein K first SAM-like domain-containing protein n=1 Tax=Rhodoplanes serenus TaxID=200615 RepID=A0A447CYX1_9BRAD|nr:type II secretion system protein GspK [Rhodoplanes serenus]VCU10506.1 hypothetical protein RHODGE_RHODGE_04105 [Rhodoplanes serenus]
MTTATRRSGQDGFMLVAVLWMMAALATLATVYAVFVTDTAALYGTLGERLRAEAAARGAVELAVHRLTAAPRHPSASSYTFRIGTAVLRTEVTAEAGRIDLNTAPKALLAGLFAAIGADPRQAESHADRVLAWRKAPSRPEEGAEEQALYRAAGRDYGPRQAAFPHVEELWLVLDLPDALVARALPFVTVLSGQPTVNILAAPPGVIASLPGMTAETTYALLAQRGRGVDEARLLALLGPAARYAGAEPGRTFRLIIDGTLDSGRPIAVETVVLIDPQDEEPYRTLSWADRSDAPARPDTRR